LESGVVQENTIFASIGYFDTESRFKLQEIFNVSKHPDFNGCMDLFIVDYGIESCFFSVIDRNVFEITEKIKSFRAECLNI